MKIAEVAPGSASFQAVLQLWRHESATLGFMPKGGFEDAARSGQLLAAVTPDGTVAGYVMSRRTARGISYIVHLCVSPAHRGQGLTRELFEAVKARCADCFEIRLRCRRDFEANALWPRLGFVAMTDRRGRGREGVLTTWSYELAPLPIMARLQQSRGEGGPVPLVIDANVFFDLDDKAPGDEESSGLLADWLSEFAELFVTAEIHNEIDRRADQRDRDRQRRRAAGFPQAPRDVGREEAALPDIRVRLPGSARPSALSDARQVAMTIAAGMTFFVTRDQDILDAAEELDKEYGLQVMSPHEVVRHFDELRRQDEYRPRRLFLGPTVCGRMARAEDLDVLVDLLHSGQAPPEHRRHTAALVRSLLAEPERYVATCIEKGDELLAAYVLDWSVRGLLEVPFFAVSASTLGRTAARHYADMLVTRAAERGRQILRIRGGGRRVDEALAALGFFEDNGHWLKVSLPGAMPPTDAAASVEGIAEAHPAAAPLVKQLVGELRSLAEDRSERGLVRGADLERTLWPGKLTSVGIRCFIVPIQPRWAKELFDRELAEGTLFGAEPRLALSWENVYYRAARPAIISAPARVLWYVSDDPKYPSSKAIRACSHVDEVVVGRPKELFRRFKRLGVYEWRDVFELAKHDLDQELMAFRFSKTELLSRPIQWDGLQRVLEWHTGKGSQLQSPLAISEECFLDLYQQQGPNDGA